MIADNDGTNPSMEQPSWTHEIALSVYTSYLLILLLSSNNCNERAGERVVHN